MLRGKKTEPKTIYAIMASWAITGNLSETSRMLDIPVKTVEKIVKDNEDKPEFKKLISDAKDSFEKDATDIITKGTRLMNRHLDRALECEKELDELIRMVCREDMSQDEKRRLVTKISNMQLYDIKALTAMVDKMFDKRALALGNNTEISEVIIKIPDEAKKYVE